MLLLAMKWGHQGCRPLGLLEFCLAAYPWVYPLVLLFPCAGGVVWVWVLVAVWVLLATEGGGAESAVSEQR